MKAFHPLTSKKKNFKFSRGTCPGKPYVDLPLRIMLRIGFNDNWVRHILSSISSVSLPFKVNGKICGNVTPSRGLRQGSPISPYLFIQCAESFLTLIHKGVADGRIHSFQVCRRAQKLSYLFFVDDSILFAKATMRECLEVANIISLYERASG